MSLYVIFDTTTKRVTGIRESVDPSAFNGRVGIDVLEFLDNTTPTESAVRGIINRLNQKYIKVTADNTSVEDMTQGEKDAINAAEAAALLAALRSGAKNLFDSTASDGKILKAVVILLIDELNDLRTWTRDFKTQTAAATSFSNLQTRVATLATLSNRNSDQARTAIRTKIDNGVAD